ncbi:MULTISPECIES: YcnI family protein [Rhodobacterales]|uniref:YcnI family copper-binding membrane protein n=1 Tax=Rhodobacterales TaxID=204455 RepID=UPI001E51A482|nr:MULTISPECIES: DUF1775 domain-containing protein [Paracoccaceae]MCE6970019.1 DUF1775 domain-containing protein [Cereibacter sphaeroides]
MNTMLSATLAAALLAAPAAFAHASLETGAAPAGSTYKAVLRIPHGCEGEATRKLTVEIPEGMHSVKPMPKAGWTLATERGTYAQVYKAHGKDVTSGVTRITWTGELPDDWYDEFVFRGTLGEALPEGTVLAFVVTQTCATKQVSWSELPDPATPGVEPEHPAVPLEVTAPEHHHH